MDVTQSQTIIARISENYASVRATGGTTAKERYYSQAEALTTYAEQQQGIAVTARKVGYGPAVKFPLAELDLLSGGGTLGCDAAQAYADGATIAVKPEYGSLKLFKFGPATAAQRMLDTPETADESTLYAAADNLARDLQKAKDQEAVRSQIMEILDRNDIPGNTLYQMDFDQRSDGSISVDNHPLAAEVEALVNSDKGLSDMMSFLFGFNAQANLST